MRLFAAFLVGIASLSPLACGGSTSDTRPPYDTARLAAALRRIGPGIPVPHGPPPSRAIVHVIREGTGRVMRDGEEGAARYVEIDYRTGRVYEQNWSPPNPRRFIVGRPEILPALRKGLKGIRVGGRREFVLPARLAYTPSPVVYVVELMELKKRS